MRASAEVAGNEFDIVQGVGVELGREKLTGVGDLGPGIAQGLLVAGLQGEHVGADTHGQVTEAVGDRVTEDVEVAAGWAD
ncbi:MAG: hypothetical protein R3C45_07345 [Phycisphaerales bacterium]